MKNISVQLNNTASQIFKPELFAIEHLGEMFSYIQLNDLDIPFEFLQKIQRNANKVYKAYDNIHSEFSKNLDNITDIVDKFIVYTQATEFFQEHKSLKPNVLLYFNYDGVDVIDVLKCKNKILKCCEVIIYYNANEVNDEQIKQLLKEIFKHCKINDDEVIVNNSYISLVIKPSSGLDTKEFAIKDPKINLALAYGEEFKDIDKEILTGLRKSDKGLWIFHGPPGTGKSMYIRNLIKRINKNDDIEDVIYMPSEMIGALDTPDFIPFIQNYKNSVLVIEDADVALESRKTHGSIVKTVLQLTDGILADCLKLKIIATFNCELASIDSALLRKGRLQYRHEFRYLTKAEALKLATYLRLDLKLFEVPEYQGKEQWTLAEIYNIEQDFHWDKKTKSIGFKR